MCTRDIEKFEALEVDSGVELPPSPEIRINDRIHFKADDSIC